ncbi:MAG: energy transducer TonB [Longimicrobiaceae bacterium]
MPPAASPPNDRAVGWLIFGILAVVALALGVLSVGVYRLVERANQRGERHPEELVDFVDTTAAPAAHGEALPDFVDSAEAESRRETPADSNGPRALPPDDSTLELSEVEAVPELLNRAEVAGEIARNYPPLLRDAGVAGSVTLRMRIGSDGVVDGRSIEVLESTHDLFGEAASRVAQRLRFRPATVGGKPVPVWVTLPVAFQLS